MQTIALCICAANRPAVLERCLNSIATGTSLPDSVIVSDDSSDPSETRSVCDRFAFVRYYRGPQRGLCANRNAAISRVQTDFISLLDDDGILGKNFIEKLRVILRTISVKTVITGDVLEYGGRTRPSNHGFLGHFGTPYGKKALQNINLNSNCLPRTAFEDAVFDEALFYGYEDMDFCSSLLAQGYQFQHHPELLNEHVPPSRKASDNKKRYEWTQRARFQTSMKRYVVWERNLLHAAGFFVLAPTHRIVHALRRSYFSDVPRTFADIVLATRQAVMFRLNGPPSRV